MTRHLLRIRRDRDLRALHDPALAPLHRALTAEPTPAEVSAGPEALTAFRAVSWGRAAAGSPATALRRTWRPAVLTSVLSTVFATKVSTALAAGAVGLSSVTGAAYAGALPDTLQDVAHRTIKAPAAHKSNGVGPDATGDAAWGLCQAFSTKEKKGDGEGQGKQGTPEAKAEDKAERDAAKQQRQASARASASPSGRALGHSKDPSANGNGNGNGKANGKDGDRAHGKENSVAFRNLARAAGGADKIDAYCATIPRPSGEPDAASEDGGQQGTQAPKTKSPKPTKTVGAPSKTTAPAVTPTSSAPSP